MSKLNETDIQGFVLRGYALPVARYFFLHFEDAKRARSLIARLLSHVTTGQRWDGAKPQSTVNIAFTHRGLQHLELPDATLLAFPVEFQQGMKHRAEILGDSGVNSPDRWDEVWRDDRVHAWLGINGLALEALDARSAAIITAIKETGGVSVLGSQEAAAEVIEASRQPKNISALPMASAIPTTSASNAVPSLDKASFYPMEGGRLWQRENCC